MGIRTTYLDGEQIYPNDSKFIRHLIYGMIAFMYCLYFILSALGFGIVFVDGDSMKPTLNNNEILFGYHSKEKNIHRGDIIIFNAKQVDPRDSEDKYYIKRIIGMPGDTVAFNGKHLLVNGKEYHIKGLYDQNEYDNMARTLTNVDKNVKKWNLQTLSTRNFNNISGSYYWNLNSINTVKVPAHSYFVMGDNRSISNDSREFGYVNYSDIQYKVLNEALY